MFKPTITKEWLLATMDLEGDGFANAGGIRDKYPDEEPSFFTTGTSPSLTTVTKEWLLATMELEGDGFANARSETSPEELVDAHVEEARGEELTGRIHFSAKSLPQSKPRSTVALIK